MKPDEKMSDIHFNLSRKSAEIHRQIKSKMVKEAFRLRTAQWVK